MLTEFLLRFQRVETRKESSLLAQISAVIIKFDLELCSIVKLNHPWNDADWSALDFVVFNSLILQPSYSLFQYWLSVWKKCYLMSIKTEIVTIDHAPTKQTANKSLMHHKE